MLEEKVKLRLMEELGMSRAEVDSVGSMFWFGIEDAVYSLFFHMWWVTLTNGRKLWMDTSPL